MTKMIIKAEELGQRICPECGIVCDEFVASDHFYKDEDGEMVQEFVCMECMDKGEFFYNGNNL